MLLEACMLPPGTQMYCLTTVQYVQRFHYGLWLDVHSNCSINVIIIITAFCLITRWNNGYFSLAFCFNFFGIPWDLVSGSGSGSGSSTLQ